jgi:transposase InsO family protein
VKGKLYLCAIKDIYSNRIVGYSIDSRMKSRIAVAALDNAVARRNAAGVDVADCGPASPPRAYTPTVGRNFGPGSWSTNSTATT